MSQPLPFEFNPMRDELYTAEDLYAGFDANDADSFARSPDCIAYAFFRRHNHPDQRRNSVATLQALHDNGISNLIGQRLVQYPKVVAIMGGHKMLRGDASYRSIASIAAELTNNGFLVCSGGGPGAMEAAHLGALTKSLVNARRDAYIDELAQVPSLPTDTKLADDQGRINAEVARNLHQWLKPAMTVRAKLLGELGAAAGYSISVPTWLYGHEPSTPFASHIAKYFQNSLREDGLVTIASSGIVFAEGKAGTLQEAFQDAAQNYYDTVFRPMVFLAPAKKPDYWTTTMPIQPLISALLGAKLDYKKRVFFTHEERLAIDFLLQQ